MAPAFLTIEDVLRITGMKRRTLYNWRARGDFPQPVRIGQREVVYPRETIDAWAAQHTAHRDPVRCDTGMRAAVG